MRSQIILALLATAISAAPVLNTGAAKNSQLSKRDAAPGLQVDILENEDASNSQLSKRDAEPGMEVDILENEDASEAARSKRSPGATALPLCYLADGTPGTLKLGEDGKVICV